MTNAGTCHDFAAGTNDAKLGDRGNAMKDMLLHWSPRSPFVRKVMIAAHECGLADRIETVRTVVAASQPNTELMKDNPQSRLPTLRVAGGTVVYDSPVICEYFDMLAGGGKLFPQAFPERLGAARGPSLRGGKLRNLLLWGGGGDPPPAPPAVKNQPAGGG